MNKYDNHYKYSNIVITCGVSGFNANNAPRKWLDEQKLLDFSRNKQNPDPPTGKDKEQAKADVEKALARLGDPGSLTRDPKKVSAEFSALHALRQADRIVDRNLRVTLIHTETLGGEVAAKIIKKLIEHEFDATVDLKKCPFNVKDRDELRYNLADFMSKVANALKENDPSCTCFAPLGGFKVMTSLGYLAGAYLGFPTIYVHEDDQVYHELPAIPLNVSEDKLRELAPLLKQVGTAAELAELSEDDQKLIRENSWLFERAEGTVAVNAFGLFLMEQHPHIFSARILVAPEVDKLYGNEGRKGFILQQLQELIKKLKHGSTDADLQHEKEWSDLKPDDDWHLYKGASNGQQVCRAIYKWDKKDDTLYVKAVLTNHDKYEEEFENKWGKAANLEQFVDWSQQ